MGAVAEAAMSGDSAAFFEAIRQNPEHVFSAEIQHENALEPGAPGFMARLEGAAREGMSMLRRAFNDAGAGHAAPSIAQKQDMAASPAPASRPFKPG